MMALAYKNSSNSFAVPGLGRIVPARRNGLATPAPNPSNCSAARSQFLLEYLWVTVDHEICDAQVRLAHILASARRSACRAHSRFAVLAGCRGSHPPGPRAEQRDLQEALRG